MKFERELKEKEDLLCSAYVECRQAEIKLQDYLKQKQKEEQKLIKIQKVLIEKEKILSHRLVHYHPFNVDRREAHRDKKIEALKAQLTELESRLQSEHSTAEKYKEERNKYMEQRDKFRDSRKYFRGKKEKDRILESMMMN
ncbi:probable ATP-dependent RNA helicase ddx55 [Ptychodera flava]|uniref:probable ATP-dependent RNA helicase ddx55 n=1 Tax=Ptychodera flava TaxID=63121 RepID=UPI00396AA87B